MCLLKELGKCAVIVKHNSPELACIAHRAYVIKRIDNLAVIPESPESIIQREIKQVVACKDEDVIIYLLIFKHEKNIATKQFDYMCCKLPVVASDLAPFRDFLGKARAGIITDTSDPQKFADAIMELLENRKQAEEMGNNGRQFVERFWNWERQADALRQAFASVIPPHRQQM